MSTLFINGTLAVIKSVRKLSNTPYWLVTFVVVPFNEMPLFSAGLITFIIFLF